MCLCLLFALMYRYAGKQAKALILDEREKYHTLTSTLVWFFASLIGGLAITLALILPDRWVPLSGFAYSLLGVVLPVLEIRRARRAPTA